MNQNAPNQWLPEPRPPVSGPAQQQPRGAVGNTGVVYGTQSLATWAPGDVTAKQVCDALKPAALWRFSAFGHVLIRIDYGTLANRRILNLRAPLVLTIPGQFTAEATPLDGNGAECRVTLTQATAGARSIARGFVDAGGGAVALDEGATDYWALTNSTLTIAGVAVAVPALSIVPLVSGAVLNTGSGFQEFES
jgi:hypothetical protein